MEKIREAIKDFKDIEFRPDVEVLQLLESKNQALYMILSFTIKAIKLIVTGYVMLELVSSILSLFCL